MNNESLSYLEELLSYSSSRTFKEEAKKLCERYERLSYIVQLDEYMMTKTGECSESAAHLLRLAVGLTSRRITDKYKFGKKYLQNELKEYICALFLGGTVETIYMLLFDDAGRLIGCEYIGEGTVNSSGVLPRKLIDISIRQRAKGVILAHNHPCGNARPSVDDISTTSFIYTSLKNADIRLLAHYTVSGFDIVDCLASVPTDGQ